MQSCHRSESLQSATGALLQLHRTPSTSPKAKEFDEEKWEFDEEKWLERWVNEGMKCGYGSAAHMAPLSLSLTSAQFDISDLPVAAALQ